MWPKKSSFYNTWRLIIISTNRITGSYFAPHESTSLITPYFSNIYFHIIIPPMTVFQVSHWMRLSNQNSVLISYFHHACYTNCHIHLINLIIPAMIRKSEGMTPLGRLTHWQKDNIIIEITKLSVRLLTRLFWLRSVINEHNNEHTNYIKDKASQEHC
jgi:hypothetical protein